MTAQIDPLDTSEGVHVLLFCADETAVRAVARAPPRADALVRTVREDDAARLALLRVAGLVRAQTARYVDLRRGADRAFFRALEPSVDAFLYGTRRANSLVDRARAMWSEVRRPRLLAMRVAASPIVCERFDSVFLTQLAELASKHEDETHDA